MFLVTKIDEKNKSCVISYNGKKFSFWYDWHLGDITVRDSHEKSIPMRTRFAGLDKYNTWKEKYSSKEFKEGVIAEMKRLGY